MRSRVKKRKIGLSRRRHISINISYTTFTAIKQTLLSKATYSNSYIHWYTDGGGCHARCRPSHQGQFGVQCLAQGHFDMQIRGIEPMTFRKQAASSNPSIFVDLTKIEDCITLVNLLITEPVNFPHLRPIP